MKLIDLLVQELPKRGGFVVGANEAVQDADGKVKFFDSARLHFDHGYDVGRWCGSARSSFYCVGKNSFSTNLADDYETAVVTREQYEAALQQSVWDGEGLPPVGCKFEYGSHRTAATCLGVGFDMVFAWKGNPLEEDYEEFIISIEDSSFHAPRTEAERKREETIAAIYKSNGIRARDGGQQSAIDVYEAIAAGKIPGVKLDG